MEENKARKQPPHSYPTSHNLARQPYHEPDDVPLEEENVVPIKPRFDSVAEDPLLPRSSAKRKQSTGKPRSTSKQKSAKPLRSPQVNKQSPFADELQHLEELAERINQVLAQRAQKKAWMEQSQSMSSSDSAYAQPYGQQTGRSFVPLQSEPSLEQEETETLKQQARRIRQRLSQLEVMMEDEQPDSPTHPDPSAEPNYYYDRSRQHPQQQPQYPSPQRVPAQPSQPYSHPQPAYPQAHRAVDPRQRAEQEAWRAREELRLMQGQLPTELDDHPHDGYRDRSRSQSYEPALRQSLSSLRRWKLWQVLELPPKPIDRLGNAAMWVAIAAVLRLSSRYVLSAFPLLSPVLTLLMLAPAVLAVFLAVFVPKTGWVPFYRLFLIMLGLFIGGKF